jgi:hypothetical protein
MFSSCICIKEYPEGNTSICFKWLHPKKRISGKGDFYSILYNFALDFINPYYFSSIKCPSED